ncbi:MAG TPA: hypothetical protein VJ456_14330 [Acidimicrobiia bacterium]|nr:hypothetical protein [Acidimicrobiia bacterium]
MKSLQSPQGFCPAGRKLTPCEISPPRAAARGERSLSVGLALLVLFGLPGRRRPTA